MKKTGNYLSVFLAALTLLSGAACGGGKESGSGAGPDGGYPVIDLPADTESKGVHEVSVSDGGVDFAVGGKVEHEIVIPAEADTTLQSAASELRVFVFESTGTEMPVVTDEEVTWSPAAKYFVLGADNALTEAAGIQIPEGLGRRGAYVETEGNSVFLAGETSTGTLNAVYEWLHYQLDWEIYSTEVIVQQTDVKDMKLKEMRIVEVPDIEDINSTYGWTDNDAITSQRLRYTNEYWIPVGGNNHHNSFDYVPPAEYKDKYPEWFSDDGLQLCYTAHGKDTLDEMIDVAVESMKEALIAYPHLENISLTHQDTTTWCSCSACAELNRQYGTDAVSVIRFCNAVNRKIQAWFQTPEGAPYARDLKIMFFAYHATQVAPVTYDAASDTYSPIDDTVICDDNVGVIYAPIRASYQVPLDDEYNELYYDTVRGWTAVCKNLCMWTYSTNFHYYLVPTNTYNSMQYNYRLWAEVGTQWLNDQSQYNSIQSTGFCALKLYLNTKLRWNVNYDMDELIGNFFDVYFGPAADTMMTYFNELRAHFLFMEETMDYVGYCYIEPLETRYWPNTLLERWIGYCDEAMEDIAGLQRTDPNAYDMYAENILLESISPRYLLLDLWGSLFSPTELTALRNEFRSDCNALEVNRYAEKNAITDLWNSWNL